MSIIVPNASERALLNIIRTELNLASIKLFKNNIVPDQATVLGDMVEATFPSYVLQSTTGWGVAATGVDNRAIVEDALHTWTRGAGAGSEIIYGYYIVSLGGLLLFCERNPVGGLSIDTAGQTYTVLPRFQLTEIGG